MIIQDILEYLRLSPMVYIVDIRFVKSNDGLEYALFSSMIFESRVGDRAEFVGEFSNNVIRFRTLRRWTLYGTLKKYCNEYGYTYQVENCYIE